jgi:hypothetical protein
MACVNQTWPHCVNQMGKTPSKSLAERHGMCELTLIVTVSIMSRCLNLVMFYVIHPYVLLHCHMY